MAVKRRDADTDTVKQATAVKKQSHNYPKTRRKQLTPEQTHKAVDLIDKGLSHSEAAKVVDAERSAITKAVQPYLLNKEALEKDKKELGNIFLDLSMRYARSITDEDIKKTPPGARVTNMAIAYDKYRLETGQSTENVSVITQTAKSLRELNNVNDND